MIGNKGPVLPMEVTWFSTPEEEWKSPSKIKAMLTVFFDCEDVVHHEYTPPGQTIKEYYSVFFVG